MKIIERVVEATHEPNKNDLWLKPEEGGPATLNRYAGGQWHPIGGSSESGSGCDCDTSDFVRISDLFPTVVAPNESFTVEFDDDYDNTHYALALIPDEKADIYSKLAVAGVLKYVKLTKETNAAPGSGYTLTFDNEWMEFRDENIAVCPSPMFVGSSFEQYMPEGFVGWVVLFAGTLPFWPGSYVS